MSWSAGVVEYDDEMLSSVDLMSCEESSVISAMAPVRKGLNPSGSSFLPPRTLPVWGSGLSRFGKYNEPAQPKHVLMEVLVAGRPPIHIRHPGNLVALRGRLARILAFAESSLKVQAEVAEDEGSKGAPTDEAPRVMRVRVSGRPLATFLDLLFVLLSWVNLATACLFCAFILYASPAPPPYVYGAALPLVPLYYFARSAHEALQAEYLVNEPLRDVLGRKAGEILLLVVLSVLGPDTLLLLAGISLLPRGVRLSDECTNTLRARAAIIAPLLLDAPMLILNHQYHKRTETPYDPLSLAALALSVVSLAVHFPWRVLRMIGAQRRQLERLELDGDADFIIGSGHDLAWKEPTEEELAAAASRPMTPGADAAPTTPGGRVLSPVRQLLREESTIAQLELKKVRERTLMSMRAGDIEEGHDPFDA